MKIGYATSFCLPRQKILMLYTLLVADNSATYVICDHCKSQTYKNWFRVQTFPDQLAVQREEKKGGFCMSSFSFYVLLNPLVSL